MSPRGGAGGPSGPAGGLTTPGELREGYGQGCGQGRPWVLALAASCSQIDLAHAQPSVLQSTSAHVPDNHRHGSHAGPSTGDGEPKR